MQVPTCVPPYLQQCPQRRRAGRDPAAPVTFAPALPGSGPPHPATLDLPQPLVRRTGRAESETAGHLPFSPSLPVSHRPSRLRRSPSHLSLGSSHWVLVLAPGTLARGGAQRRGSRETAPGGGDRPGPQNSNSRRAPILPGAHQTQAPPLLTVSAPAGVGPAAARPSLHPTPPPPRRAPPRPAPDAHCATQGPRYESQLSPTNPNEHRATREPAEPLPTLLRGPPLGCVCLDVRERGSGGSGRHRAPPVPVPAPRAVLSPAKGCGTAAYLFALGLQARESRTQDARRPEYPGERCAGFGLEAWSLRSCPKFGPLGLPPWASLPWRLPFPRLPYGRAVLLLAVSLFLLLDTGLSASRALVFISAPARLALRYVRMTVQAFSQLLVQTDGPGSGPQDCV